MKFLVVFFLVAAAVAADDGSWSSERDTTASPGALYSMTGQIPVVMEKEYLELTDVESGATRAVFQFHNTSDQPVTAECAFPIDVVYNVHGGISLGPKGVIPGDTGIPIIDVGSAHDLRGRENGLGQDGDSWFDLLGLPLQPWDPEKTEWADEEDAEAYGGRYLRLDQYPQGRKDYPASLAAAFSLEIKQDGAPVDVTSCVVDFGKQPGCITFHFRHQMKLAAGGTTRLEVSYAWPTISGKESAGAVRYSQTTTTYTWNYILETASSWQGKLGSLLLAFPIGPGLPAPWKPLGIRNGRSLWLWTSAKPGPKDNLALSWSNMTRDFEGLWSDTDIEHETAQPFRENSMVVYGGASSELKDKADVYLPDGVMSAPFSGDRLFDGYRETCWAVHTANGGVGESVNFTLKAPTGAIAIQNGYLRSIDDYPAKSTSSFYAKNNRVKRLSLIKGTAVIATFDLADTRDDLQYFNVALAPGQYTARIDAIYPGTKYNDTCLGEFEFLPGDPVVLAAIDKDPFFAQGR